MSSQKTSNNDSCRDLNGRRISTIKEASRMAEYIENEPLRKKAAAEAQRSKLEALEKQLGIEPDSASSSSGQPGQVAGKKHRFDDTEYLEQSRDLVEGVKSAVAAGLLKKRKKAKTTPESPSGAGSKSGADAATSLAPKPVATEVVTTS
ncbi:hypothetical protein BS47DRAFT_1421286 [Hydnum rufescens UP504]|uniref:SDE2-like domain-containing protein n=1 Tax=Hydnum rufescens UP504 TaxID=1448309 RepID=A0A9P6AMF5_9AGAM|nr:hypothetical protein BS47DRAFT_1421286 [Hydnum rufescens UP504]